MSDMVGNLNNRVSHHNLNVRVNPAICLECLNIQEVYGMVFSKNFYWIQKRFT